MSALLVALIAALLVGMPLRAVAQYEVGDLYLFSHALPTINYGVMRIDPISGAASTHYDVPDSPTPWTAVCRSASHGPAAHQERPGCGQ